MDLSDNSKVLGKGPKVRICYICGRGYGVNSYEIHLAQCKDLWIAREATKDKKDRKPLPVDPSTIEGGENTICSGGGKMDLDALNQRATDTFNTESLSTCPYCGRTFLPEKLVIHNKSCTAENPARRVAGKADNLSSTSPASSNVEASPKNIRPKSSAASTKSATIPTPTAKNSSAGSSLPSITAPNGSITRSGGSSIESLENKVSVMEGEVVKGLQLLEGLMSELENLKIELATLKQGKQS